jgi:hypothetical protein
MTAETTDTAYVWPARHEAGAASNPDLPPMGARFRLDADFDISGYSPQAQVVLRAMQQYGLILADNGSNWYFGGTADPAWPQSLIDELKTVPASAFEAVDESSLMVSPDSGQARQPAAPSPTTNPSPTIVASTTSSPPDTSPTAITVMTTATTGQVSSSVAPPTAYGRRSALGRSRRGHPSALSETWWLALGLVSLVGVAGGWARWRAIARRRS